MELYIRGKTYKLAWEYIIAPGLVFLALIILLVVNASTIKHTWVQYTEDDPANSSLPQAQSSELSAISPAKLEEINTYKNSDVISPLSEQQEASKININKANAEELITLPFIGEVKAKAIIEYRSKNGSFKSVEELDNIKGIGAKTLEKLRPYITLE